MRTQTPPSRRGRRPQPVPHTNARRTRRPRRVARPKPLDPNTTVRKRGNVYFMFHKTQSRVPWRLIIALLIVFIGAIGSAFSYAQIHSVQREITRSRQALSDQQVANTFLDAMVIERYTHNEIERRAHELGLRPPDPSQIIYFHVPRQSGVSVSIGDSLPPPENYFWQGIVSFFQGIRERIFG